MFKTFEDEKMHREYLLDKMDTYDIPKHCRHGLLEYIMEGRPVGHFLSAVLENKLMEAVNRADFENQQRLVNYVKFLYNHAPNGCCGYEGVMKYWRERGGLLQIMKITADKPLHNFQKNESR